MGEDADHVIGDLKALRRPRVFIISGPSGVGKDSVIEQLRQRYPEAHYAVTATTRNRRPGVYGNLYGVPRDAARAALARGQDVFFKVDVQGAAEIRRLIPTAVTIFLAPESAATLLQRLKHRKTDDPAVLMTRFATATQELSAAFDFDYVIFNRQDRLEQALDEIMAIVKAEKVRSTQPDAEL
jgi:guanylate kinase